MSKTEKNAKQNVGTFLVSVNETHDVKRRIADLFVSGKKYNSQNEIAEAYYDKYHEKIAQGTISKALSELRSGFRYSNSEKIYYITRLTRDSAYSCMDEKAFRQDKRYQMIVDDDLFQHTDIWAIKGRPETFVFWIKGGKMEKAKADMRYLLGDSNVLDIFDYQDKLFVVLKPQSRCNLHSFFDLDQYIF